MLSGMTSLAGDVKGDYGGVGLEGHSAASWREGGLKREHVEEVLERQGAFFVECTAHTVVT